MLIQLYQKTTKSCLLGLFAELVGRDEGGKTKITRDLPAVRLLPFCGLLLTPTQVTQWYSRCSIVEVGTSKGAAELPA